MCGQRALVFPVRTCVEMNLSLPLKDCHYAAIDRLRAMQIAGRVIPAIATATSVASGLATLEAVKVLRAQHHKPPRRSLRASFVNLGTSMWGAAAPQPPVTFLLPGGDRASEWRPVAICADINQLVWPGPRDKHDVSCIMPNSTHFEPDDFSRSPLEASRKGHCNA